MLITRADPDDEERIALAEDSDPQDTLAQYQYRSAGAVIMATAAAVMTMVMATHAKVLAVVMIT